MISWIYYPRSKKPPALARNVVACFENIASKIDSDSHGLTSDQVLASVAPGLIEAGFRVETGKTKSKKIPVPVLFGLNGAPEKSFEADACHEGIGFVLEVEAGRAVLNNEFLKDLFEACVMHNVNYLGIAVRRIYKASKDFQRVTLFFDTLYASNRLPLPLEGILVIGY